MAESRSRENSSSDLNSPLLFNHNNFENRGAAAGENEVIIDVLESNGDANNTTTNSSPFYFLGAGSGFSLPKITTIDPFRNHTPDINGLYEWVKIMIIIPVALIRLAIFGISIAVGFLATKLALAGWKDRQSPMPTWRTCIMWITRVCSRCILFSFGYHWIRRIGKPEKRETAPIVVSNHVSYVEPIFFFYELFPIIVASESHDSLPFAGAIIRSMQVIYVDRMSAASRRHAVNEIKRKSSCNNYPHVLLFPEGTTTNGRSLITFQLGAFIPGFPVQPVIVRYPYIHFDQSWSNVSLGKLMFRMFTQFHNFMEVEYLPVVEPLKSKEESTIQFAERTGYAMASALNVVQTRYSYADLMLLTRAAQLTNKNCSNYLVEMPLARTSYHVSTAESMEFLEQFCAMSPDSNGLIDMHGFLDVYGIWNCPLTEKIFAYLDVEKKGCITFRQFLLGSAHVRKQPSFWNACNVAFIKCSNSSDHISLTQLGEAVKLSMPHTCNVTVNRLFKIFDVDNDGIISRDDFMTCLGKNPLLIAIFFFSQIE